MSPSRQERSGLAIMTEILALTRKMAASGDADFLVSSVDRRGQLIEEYDRLRSSSPGAAEALERDKPEIGKMIDEIIGLDKVIDASLRSLHTEAKNELENSVSHKKVLKYTNNAISSSGSYMDYKK